MTHNVGDNISAEIRADVAIREQQRQTELLKSIRSGVRMIALMLLLFGAAFILAIVGASA